jgi:hypothetical protein
MALETTQPLTEMSTRLFPVGKGGWCVRLATLPPSCAVVMKSGNLTSWNPPGQSRPVTGLVYLYLYLCKAFVTRYSHWGLQRFIPSGRNTPLDLTQSLTEMSSNGISWG